MIAKPKQSRRKNVVPKPGRQDAQKGAPNVFPVVANGRTREQLIAQIAVLGDLANAGTTVTFSHGQLGEGDISEAAKSLQESIKASSGGSTAIADHLLIGQAVALNAIFNELMRRGAMNMNEYPEAMERYMRLGLKAQSQCRTTLESLSKIKNPPNVAFVKQANIAHGHQQVNNAVEPGVAAGAAPRAYGKSESAPIELLENDHGEWLDTRAAGTTGKGDPQMATVGEVHGTTDGSGESRRKR